MLDFLLWSWVEARSFALKTVAEETTSYISIPNDLVKKTQPPPSREERCFKVSITGARERQQQGLPFFIDIDGRQYCPRPHCIFTRAAFITWKGRVSASELDEEMGWDCCSRATAALQHLPLSVGQSAPGTAADQKMGGKPCPLPLQEKAFNQKILTVINCYSSYRNLKCPCPLLWRPSNFEAFFCCCCCFFSNFEVFVVTLGYRMPIIMHMHAATVIRPTCCPASTCWLNFCCG